MDILKKSAVHQFIMSISQRWNRASLASISPAENGAEMVLHDTDFLIVLLAVPVF